MDVPQYMPPVKLGETMRALGLGEVVKSANPGFSAGDRVVGLMGWTEYAVGHPTLMGWVKDPSGGKFSAEMLLGPLSATGLTAYFFMYEICKPRSGDNVLVSGAAGATGMIAVQLAKMSGCRVVAIAGGADKCAFLKSIGADETIDYKKDPLADKIKELAGPNGYDIFFDNVGGETLEAALDNLALHARICICGAISNYQRAQKVGPANYSNIISRRATMSGALVTDFKDQFQTAGQRLAKWLMEGKLKFQADVQEGPLEKAPEVLNRLFTGANQGKQIHKISH